MSKPWISPVFLGLTRPSMVGGVTVEYWSLIVMCTISVFILSGTLAYLTLYVPLHLIGCLACRYDPHIFRLLRTAWECPPVRNKSLWGVQSYDPM